MFENINYFYLHPMLRNLNRKKKSNEIYKKSLFVEHFHAGQMVAFNFQFRNQMNEKSMWKKQKIAAILRFSLILEFKMFRLSFMESIQKE